MDICCKRLLGGPGRNKATEKCTGQAAHQLAVRRRPLPEPWASVAGDGRQLHMLRDGLLSSFAYSPPLHSKGRRVTAYRYLGPSSKAYATLAGSTSNFNKLPSILFFRQNQIALSNSSEDLAERT